MSDDSIMDGPSPVNEPERSEPASLSVTFTHVPCARWIGEACPFCVSATRSELAPAPQEETVATLIIKIFDRRKVVLDLIKAQREIVRREQDHLHTLEKELSTLNRMIEAHIPPHSLEEAEEAVGCDG